MSNGQRIVFFDGICKLCNGVVQFIIKHDEAKVFRFAPLQSQAANCFLDKKVTSLHNNNSILYWRNHKLYDQSDAVLYILYDLGRWWRVTIIFFIVPRFIRNVVYSFIAKNRYRWWGKRLTCMIPDKKLEDRFLQ